MTLEATIALHRELYREELRIPRTTSRHVPADTEPIQISEYDGTDWKAGAVQVEVTDSGELGGMPFSHSMNRRLGPSGGFGAQYPWAHSWSFLRRACRNDHPGHYERKVFGGSLCWQVVSWCVISEYQPETIADILQIPVADVSRHLLRAFRWIEEDMDRKQRFRNARDPKESEEPTPSRLTLLQCDAANRAVQDFDLEQRIWESQRAIQRQYGLELAAWETEWARRQAVLLDHKQECDRCRRAA